MIADALLVEAAINAATTAGLNTQLLPQAPTAGFRCAGSRDENGGIAWQSQSDYLISSFVLISV